MSRKLLGLVVVAACSGRPSPGAQPPVGPPGPPTLTLFALAEVRGQIEPCGCTTNPLGDLARTSEVIAAARAAGPVLVVDAGSLLYSKNPVPPAMEPQEDMKADLLAQAYREQLQVAAVGVGPADLARGPERLRLPRMIANLTSPPAGVAVEPPRVIEVGAAKIGVFGVAAPEVAPGLGLGDPIAAGRGAVATLRGAGAQLVVGLVSARDRKAVVQLARGIGGIDLVVGGLGATAPEPKEVSDEAQDLGDGTWLVVPGNRGQVLSQLAITLRPGGGALIDAIGPAGATARQTRLAADLTKLDAELAAFAKDPTADPAFVATKRRERQAAVTEQAALARSPWRVPTSGNYFALTQVRIDRALACTPALVTAKTEYSRTAGAANVAAAQALPPPPPPKPGTALYVGDEACADCHGDALAFWKKTRHAGAWETLEKASKQYDLDCISCHVTGYDKPGGASLRDSAGKVDVQCESCHGPASLHVDADGEDAPRTIVRSPAPELCATACHTPEHSDTFELSAYLRDILGPGHGADRRASLGDGPTGRQLREAGLAKAAKTLGAGCPK